MRALWRGVVLFVCLSLSAIVGCGSQSIDEGGKVSDEEMKRNVENARKAEGATKSP
jgi:hypothetical protein